MKIEDIIKTDRMSIPSRTMVNLLYTTNEISNRFNEVMKPFDISPPQFNVLRILKGQKGNPANLCTIQERMVNRMSNTTRIIDKLIDKGLVERTQCPQNRRKVEIFITPDGLELLEQVSLVVANTEKEIVKSLSDKELEGFNRMLDTLRS